MKKENKALKFIGRFFASVLLPLLISLIIGSSIFTSARSLLTVNSVTDIMKSIPYDEIIEPESFEKVLSEIAEKSGEEIKVSGENINSLVSDVLDSKPVKKIVELYAEDAASILAGDFESANISADKIKDIFSDHSDDIVEIITDNFPELDKKEVEDTVDTIIDEHLGEIVEELPELEELNQEIEGMEELKAFRVLFTDTVLYIIWGVVAVIALLIFVCRLYHFKGLKWIGIGSTIAGAFLLLIATVLNSDLISELIDIEVLMPVIGKFASNVYTAGFIAAGVGVLLIAGAIALHFVYKNKANREQEKLEQAKTEPAQVQPAQTEAASEVAKEETQNDAQ